MRVLYTTPVLHYPALSGAELRINNSITALSDVCELHLYVRKTLGEIGGMEALRYYRQVAHRVYFSPSRERRPHMLRRRWPRRLVNALLRRLGKPPVFTTYFGEEDDYRHLAGTAGRIQAGVIWLGYGNISYPLLKYLKNHSGFPIVLDTDSVWSRFVRRELPYAASDQDRERILREAAEKEAEEQWGTRVADVTTAVSPHDAEYYRTLAEMPEKVQLFANVIDHTLYAGAVSEPEPFSHPCLFMAGSFYARNCPMEDAARWFITEIFETVREAVPGVHLYIAGNLSNERLADIHHPDITITGRLPSVLPYMKNADVILVPLRFESGTRFKILEAGACRLPVVSTTLGAEGLEVIDQVDLYLADCPEEFARAAVKLLQDADSRENLAESLYHKVLANYTLAALSRQARHILNLIERRSRT